MSANRCVTARLRATDRPSSAGSNWFSVRWSSELPKNCVSHIDACHSRQPLVKGERLVRYEVNAVMASHETFGFSRQASKCAAYTHTHTHGGSFKKSARTIYGHALRGPPPQWSMVLDRVGPPLPCGVVWVLRSPSPVVWRGFVGVVGSGPLAFLEVCGPCCAVCPPSFAGGVGGIESVAVWHVVGVLWWS